MARALTSSFFPARAIRCCGPRGRNRCASQGSVVVPPSQWFHQHFNSGVGPARYLALRKGGGGRYKFPIVFHDGEAGQSIKEGGSQIEYEDEEASIHQQFEAALAKAGAHCAMGELHPRCSTR